MTSTSKHAFTAAPWAISGQAGYTGHSVKGADGRSVAAFPSTSKRSKEERDANACLIAAAPELLAALKIAQSCLASTTSDSLYDSAKATIRAAIAKTGGAA